MATTAREHTVNLFRKNDVVEIQTMNGPVEATVIRDPWGRKGDHISVRTNEARPRTFVRLVPAVRKLSSR